MSEYRDRADDWYIPKHSAETIEDLPPLLYAGEVAALIRVHPNTLARWAREGRVRCVELPGGGRRYYRDDFLPSLGVDA